MKPSDLRRMVAGGEGQKTKVIRGANGSISVTSVPLTDEDLAKKAAAQARRERRAQRLASILPTVSK